MSPAAKASIWIACLGLLLGLTLDNTRPYAGDEAYYVASAIDMVRSGDLLVPRYGGEVRFQKPIVSYWATALGYAAFGVHLWSGRLPFLAMALALLAIVYRFSRQLGADGDLAWLNVTLLSSSTLFLEAARVSMTDLPLAFFATLALWLYVRAIAAPGPQAWPWWAAAGATGGAMASKGPFGALPLAAAGLHLLVDRPPAWRERWRALRSPAPLAAAAIVGGAWYVFILWAHGQDVAGTAGAEADAVFALAPQRWLPHAAFYAWVLVGYHVPAVAVAACVLARRRAAWPTAWRPLAWMVALTIAAACLLLARHKARYLLVATPALSMLAGFVIHRAGLAAPARRAAIAWTGLQLAVLLAYPVVVGRPFNDLVRHWERQGGGTLGTAGISTRDAAWVNALAGGGLLDDPRQAAFLLVREEQAGAWPGYAVERREQELASVGWEGGRVVTRARTYLLLRAATAPSNPGPP